MNLKVLKAKRLFVLFLFLCTIEIVSGQYVIKHTIHAGVTETTFKSDNFARNMQIDPFTGAFFGYTISADFDKKYELSTGFFISEKGYIAEYDTSFYYDQIFESQGTPHSLIDKFKFDDNLKLTYLEFPFIIKKGITPLIAVYGGFNISVLLHANIDNKFIGYRVEGVEFEEEIKEPYRIGKSGDASFYIGGEIRVADWIGLNFQYGWGLIKLDTSGKANTRINTVRFGLFYVFNRT